MQASQDITTDHSYAEPEAVMVHVDALRQRIQDRLTQQLDPHQLQTMSDDRRRALLRPAAARLIDDEEPAMSLEDRERLLDGILDDLLGLGPLEPLLADPTISEILINGPHEAYVERGGELVEVRVRFRDDDHLLSTIERIVSRVGRRIDDNSPMVDARLPDGSRVNAIIPPLAIKGPTLSIRRFGNRALTMEDLLGFRALAPEMAYFLEAAVKARLNIVVSGGTGSGKTTLLNVLSGFISERDRILTIEDAAELRLQQRHVVALETRPANTDGKNGVSMRDLVRNALRMRPDRILIGECRGAEAFDMLQAMNSGHEGSLTTLHANTPRDALTRLETLLMMAGYEIPLKAMRRQIASALQLIVQVERLAGGARRITAVTEVVGMEGDILVTQDVYTFQQTGVDVEGRAVGNFLATGIRPAFSPRLRTAGYELPPTLFQQRILLRT